MVMIDSSMSARAVEEITRLKDAEEQLKAEYGKLETRHLKLLDTLENVMTVGHNDDCMFCGFKDKEAKAAIEGDKEYTK